jgi:AP-1 complex subunit gamma-1
MLMDMLGGGAPAPAPAGAPPGGMGGGLMDVMGGGMMGGAAPNPAFQAYSKDGLTIQFTCTKDANPSVTIVDAAFSNAQGSPMTGFSFQVAVPKFMKLQMSPASSDTLPPMSSGAVTQQFKLANSLHGQKPLLVKLKIDFTFNGQPMSEMAQVENFPAGF